MFCPACGVQNEEGSIFCANCGTKFSNSQQQSESYQNHQYQDTPQKPQYANNQTSGYDRSLYKNNPAQSNTQQGYRQQPGMSRPRQYGQQHGQYPVEDKVNPLLYVIALIFPIGIILFFANKRDKPKTSRNFLFAALIGFFLLI